MDCQQISPLLSKYMDQELNTKETALVYEHTTGCVHCKEEIALLEQWEKVFKKTFANHPFGSPLGHEIMGKIRQEEPLHLSRKIAHPQGKILHIFSRNLLALAAALLLVVSLSVWFLLNSPTYSPVLTRVATLKGQKGVMIFQEKQNRWMAIEGRGRVPLYSGDRVWNQSSSNYSFSLEDKTRITLDQRTQLSLQAKGGEQQLEFYGKEGKALFQVTPQTRGSFKIKAKSVLVEVVGTAFVVDIQSQQVTTTVFEGKVKVSPSHQKALFLTKGQEAQVYSRGFIKTSSLKREEYERKGAWVPTYSLPPLPVTAPINPPVKPEIPKQGPLSSPPKVPANTEKTDTPIKVNRKKK